MELEKVIQVTGENLGRLDKQKYSVDTRRQAHIRELARGFRGHIPNDEDSLEEFRPVYEDTVSALSLAASDRALLCRYMAEGSRISEKLLSVSPQKRKCTVSYVKNALSDLAYESFSGFFDRAAVVYAPDFASALEDVYHSVTDYVILPVYSEKAGRMKSFCDMADKYEMKKVLSCRVYSNTEDVETEFALFSKNLERFSGRRKGVFFEFSVPEEDILKCMSPGYDVISVNTYEGRADICLEIPDGDIEPICVFLMLELPGHTVKGIY